MAKFCTKCGKPLAEGEVCDCSKSEPKQQPSFDESTVLIKNQQPSPEKRVMDSASHGEPERRGQQSYQSNPYQNSYRQNPYQQSGQPGNPYQQGGYQQNPYQQNGQPGNPYQQGGYQQNPYQQSGQPGNPYQQSGYQQNPYQQDGQQGGYQQNPYQQNGYQGNPYGNPYQQQGMGSQWIKDKTNRFAANTKNMFAEILPMLTSPDTTMKRICDSSSPFMGLEMVGLKAVICILGAIIAVSKIKSLSYGYVNVPLMRIIIMILIMTIGFAYLQAGIFTGITKGLGGNTTLNKMMSAVGFGALVDSFMIIICALCALLKLPRLTLFMVSAFSLISFCFYLRGYEHAVSMKPDRKVYNFILAQILTGVAVLVILYIFIPLIFDIPIDRIMDFGSIWDEFM